MGSANTQTKESKDQWLRAGRRGRLAVDEQGEDFLQDIAEQQHKVNTAVVSNNEAST